MDYTIINFVESYNETGEVKTKLGDFKCKWHSTDGWRGYYDVIATKKSKWEHVNSDWLTGNWEDAGDHAESVQADKFDKMAAELKAQGYEMAVVFSLTSNVFSTGTDIFKRKLTNKCPACGLIEDSDGRCGCTNADAN